MKYSIVVVFCCWSLGLMAQDAAIVAPIKQLFEGLAKKDTAMMRAAFHEEARLATTFTDRDGVPQIVEEDIGLFIESVGSAEQVLEERIWSYDVRKDANLATVWTEYTFFWDGDLSHCGVNAFELFQTADGWRITSVVDTRRRDCTLGNAGVLDVFMDAWHKAAATADEEVFFGSMTADAVYLGTDPSERWLRDELKEWSKEYFDRESAWAFTPKERHWSFSEDGKMAWFDELLDTWMGICRGSGVLMMTEEGWKLKHYNLALTVYNEAIEAIKSANKKD